MASALLIVGQVGLTSLLVLYLYSERGWSATAAAVALGFVQLGGAAARVIAGRWSDVRDERIAPFRRLAGGAGVLLLAAAALANAPGAVLVPLLMGGGVLAMSWNGLSFTAAAEISGGAQAGRAMGMQNTLMRAAAPSCRWRSARSRPRVVARDVPGRWAIAPLLGRRAAAGRSSMTRTTAAARRARAAQRRGPAQVHRHAAPVKARPPAPPRNATASATSSGSIRRLTACGARITSSSTRSSGSACARGLIGDLRLHERRAHEAGADGGGEDAVARRPRARAS